MRFQVINVTPYLNLEPVFGFMNMSTVGACAKMIHILTQFGVCYWIFKHCHYISNKPIILFQHLSFKYDIIWFNMILAT